MTKTTATPPSVASIVYLAVLAGLTIWATVYVWIGAGTGREFTGASLGSALSTILVVQAWERMTQRAEVRRAARLDKLTSYQEVLRNTGTWTGRRPEQVFSVHWDEQARLYWVKGWIRDTFVLPDWQAWTDLESLAEHLINIEVTGWAHGDDEGTRTVRARLDIPGWDAAPEPGLNKPGPY